MERPHIQCISCMGYHTTHLGYTEIDFTTTGHVYHCMDCGEEWIENLEDSPVISQICPRCHGTGKESYDDGTMPCSECRGDRTIWWLS